MAFQPLTLRAANVVLSPVGGSASRHDLGHYEIKIGRYVYRDAQLSEAVTAAMIAHFSAEPVAVQP